MLFEDGNRIDLTFCPKEHIQEWVDREAGFKVLKDEKGLCKAHLPNPKRYWICPPTEETFVASCNEFWWGSAYVVKGICCSNSSMRHTISMAFVSKNSCWS